LKIGLAIGQTDFQVEQQNLLIGLRSRQKPPQKDSILQLSRAHDISKLRYNLQPLGSNALKAFCDIDQGLYRETNIDDALHGGESAIDVLVCTPGRLMDHLKMTSGFTLQHLRFLIIDEADRLVNQSYQNWIQSVIDATFSGPQGMKYKNNETESTGPFLKLDPVTWRRSNRDKDIDGINNVDHSVCRPVQLRKFLFSATLTKDPQKLAALGLVNPKHFDAHHLRDMSISGNSTGVIPSPNQSQMTYSLPIGLSEHTVECDAKQKPLVLLALLLEQGLIDKENGIDNGIVVVFTSSIDSTHRLARLLQLLWGRAGYGPASSIREFSSALSQKQRAKLVEKCNVHGSEDESKRIQVVVCSDGMSRGMDISSVTAVINYDIPSFAKTYVHRCGRTARAGRSGRAISVMKTGQVGMFTKMRQLIVQPDRVEKIGVKKNLVNDATTMKVYKQCVRILKKVLEAEERDDLNPSSPLTEDWMKT
jgi:ATP-dependent RNA helicase DDX51/DBP6